MNEPTPESTEKYLRELAKQVAELVSEIKVMTHKWDSIKEDTSELQHKTDNHETRITKAEVKIDQHQKSIDDWADVRKKVVTWVIISVLGVCVSAAALVSMKGG